MAAGGLPDLVPALGAEAHLAVEVAIGLLVACVAGVGWLVARRSILISMRGAFDCQLRFVPTPRSALTDSDTRWRVGIARYSATHVSFFVVLGVGWWPSRVFDRRRMSVLDRRPTSGEGLWAGEGMILRCEYENQPVELAMDAHAAGAFAVWVESGPPGRGVDLS